jgi:hypothetical protein
MGLGTDRQTEHAEQDGRRDCDEAFHSVFLSAD